MYMYFNVSISWNVTFVRARGDLEVYTTSLILSIPNCALIDSDADIFASLGSSGPINSSQRETAFFPSSSKINDGPSVRLLINLL